MRKPGKKKVSPREKKPSVVLSACMMVRNEEKNLPRCLNSIKGVVDENWATRNNRD
jgi:hypothetical protein